MFPSISELKPRRVSWGDNINWRHCWGEEIEAQLPWENGTVSALMIDKVFDDRQSLETFLVVIIYLATLLEDQLLVIPHYSSGSVCEAYP